MKELSIVVSAYNEEKTVEAVLRGLLKVMDENKIDAEIVFMDNHCTDSTGNIADSVAASDKRVKVIHRTNRPSRDLGASLKEGFANATGRYIAVMDCDLSHDPSEFVRLWTVRNDAHVIVGSRNIEGGKADMPLSRHVISGSYNILASTLLGIKCKDITAGYRLYKREVVDGIKVHNDGFGMQTELLLKTGSHGFSIKEVPIYYRKSIKEKSTLSYKKQFKYYAEPLLAALKDRFFS